MKVRISFLLVMLLLIAVFGSAQAQEQVTVKLWMHDHPPRIALDEQLIDEFMAANPDIVVEYTHIPDADFYTALATALAAGSGPDLFNTWTGQIGQLQTAGVLAPLDFEAAGFSGIEGVYEAYESGETLLAGARFGETLYGLPTELSIYGCYANDDLFRAAGLDPATDFPATWEEMVNVAEQLTVREDGVPTIRGYDFNWSGPIFMYLTMMPMIEQLGVTVINEVDYTADLNNDAVKKVMQYWADWVNVHKLGGPQYTFSRDAFVAKELGIECTMGNWGVPQLNENGIAWSLHPVPRWADAVSDNGFAIYAYFLMVNSYSSPEAQAASWKLARFLTDHPKDYFDIAGLFQPRIEFTSSDEFKQDQVMPLFLDEMTKSKPHARIAGFDEVANALGDARDRIIAGENIDTVLAEAEASVNTILERALREAQAGA